MVTCSGLTDVGVDDLWQRVLAHREHLGEDGLADKRAGQQLDFTWALVRDELDQRLRHSPGVRTIRDEVRPRCWPASCRRRWPPTGSSRRTTTARAE